MSAIRLIESARFETESMLHEDALRLRDGRLQDLGFLPFAEALSILSYVDVDQAKSSSHIPPLKNETERALRWHYNIPSLVNLPFLREALLGLSHTTLEDSWNYIVIVANRVHMAQHGKYSDAAAVNESARYTLNFIEMALSYLSEGDLAKSKSVFLAHVPQDLFKIGHSLALRLRRDLQKLSQHPAFALLNTSIARVDSPLREVIAAVMQTEPLYFTGLTDPKRGDVRPFENVREVAQVSAAIAEAAFRSAFLGAKGLGFVETEPANKNAAPFGALLGTYFVRAILFDQGSFEPLKASDLKVFFDRLEKSDTGRRLSASDKENCLKLAREISTALVGLVGVRTEQDAHSRATNYAQIVLGQIEAELSLIKDATPEAKFISSMRVSN
jgi:hypothetical protein